MSQLTETTNPIFIAEAVVSESATPRCFSGWNIHSLADVHDLYQGIKNSCRKRVQGRDDVITMALIAMLADGHILLEDHPGSGKTTLAKALGECLVREDDDTKFAAFRRIQFTPDLLPSDVTGTTMFDPTSNSFHYRPGPVFANLLLADEINRTSPKVQAALLEAMGEKQVTVDNTTHKLEELFFVMATQNPLDLMGTYPLPRAQLDRFLFKIQMSFLDAESELEVLAQWRTARKRPSQCVATADAFVMARNIISQSIQVSKKIHHCLVEIANALRNHPQVAQGISTRCLVMSLAALQAHALTQGREFVSHDDIKSLSMPLFSHRLELAAGVTDASRIVNECVDSVLESSIRRTLR